jgi:deoxyxylulose-5-phosphate synthase
MLIAQPFEARNAASCRTRSFVTVVAIDPVITAPAGFSPRTADRRCLDAHDDVRRLLDHRIKPIDEQTLIEAAEATGVIVTVEDHHAEGGIGDVVLEVFADSSSRPRIVTLAVRVMPTSGTPAELLAQAGIDRVQIAETVRTLVARSKSA